MHLLSWCSIFAEAMVQNMASGLACHGINVNAIRPGWILTQGEQQFMTVAEIKDMANAALPLGIGLPVDIAKAGTARALFLPHLKTPPARGPLPL